MCDLFVVCLPQLKDSVSVGILVSPAPSSNHSCLVLGVLVVCWQTNCTPANYINTLLNYTYSPAQNKGDKALFQLEMPFFKRALSIVKVVSSPRSLLIPIRLD